MAYETLADTGLNETCYGLCPTGGFEQTAGRIEQSAADIESVHAWGEQTEVNPRIVKAALETAEGIHRIALEDKERICALASACVLQRPWKDRTNNLVCGATPASTTYYVDLSRMGERQLPPVRTERPELANSVPQQELVIFKEEG